MPEELTERYNHLHYKSEASGEKGFIDFLYENTDSDAPEVDVDDAWKSFEKSLVKRNEKSNVWLKVAASVALLIGVCYFIWGVYSTPEQIHVATTSERMNVTFPDGSLGVLNENSSFTFDEEFGDERLVTFTGEAYFDVKKSSRPFIINTGTVKVHVLGTAFNLEKTEKGVELFVERGLVAFDDGKKQTKVQAGLKAVFNESTKEVLISDAHSKNILSWKDGILTFDDTPLSEAIRDIEEYYEVRFKLQNNQLADCRITATFDKNSLAEVLSVLESVLDIKSTRKEELIQLSGKGC